jgi:hypothetical protein
MNGLNFYLGIIGIKSSSSLMISLVSVDFLGGIQVHFSDENVEFIGGFPSSFVVVDNNLKYKGFTKEDF